MRETSNDQRFPSTGTDFDALEGEALDAAEDRSGSLFLYAVSACFDLFDSWNDSRQFRFQLVVADLAQRWTDVNAVLVRLNDTQSDAPPFSRIVFDIRRSHRAWRSVAQLYLERLSTG